MKHRTLAGLDISIENPVGSLRHGYDEDGNEMWTTRMRSHYGYIKGTVGKDKDHLDVFIKPGVTAADDIRHVHIVDQRDPKTGKFDEHKVLIGWDTVNDARKGYYENYERGWKGLMNISKMDIDSFRDWASSPSKTAKPVKDQLSKEAAAFMIGVLGEKTASALSAAEGTAGAAWSAADTAGMLGKSVLSKAPVIGSKLTALGAKAAPTLTPLYALKLGLEMANSSFYDKDRGKYSWNVVGNNAKVGRDTANKLAISPGKNALWSYLSNAIYGGLNPWKSFMGALHSGTGLIKDLNYQRRTARNLKAQRRGMV